MSYCRWSTDDFRCDLYCYQDCGGGYTTHVASNRPVGTVPASPSWDDVDDPTWAQRMADAMNAQHAFLETADRAPIGLPYDGESFNDPDLVSFLARLVTLTTLGYRAPADLLDGVRAEILDEIQLAAEYATIMRQAEEERAAYVAAGVCSGCGARSAKEAETRCRATQDQSGEYSCPGEPLWPEQNHA